MSSRVLSLWLLLLCGSLAGCELVADFDRGKLMPAEPDSGRPVSVDDDDAGTDAGADRGAD
jgi:hypothetical protein